MSLTITCTLNRSHFGPDDLVCAYLSADPASFDETFVATHITPYLDSLIELQCLGLLKVDPKWTRVSQQTVNNMIERPSGPAIAVVDCSVASGASIFFCSPIVSISLRALLVDGGLFTQLQLPLGCPPTFKGISCSISYQIVLSFAKFHKEGLKEISFPLQVVSSCGETSSYKFSQSHISTFPYKTLALDRYLFCSFDDDVPTIDNSHKFKTISIQHQRPVCLVEVNYFEEGGIVCNPGANISAVLNFDRNAVLSGNGEGGVNNISLHKCLMVKATLLSTEKRPDGSVVQEKILFTCARSAVRALLLDIEIPILDQYSPSFKSFVVEIGYRLEFEFQLETDAGMLENLLFSIPVNVNPLRSSFLSAPSAHKEARRCVDNAAAAVASFASLLNV